MICTRRDLRTLACVALLWICCPPCVGASPTHLIFWKGSFATALEAAKELHKPILVHFATANAYDWEFDSTVYRDPDVILFAGHTCLPFKVRGDAQDSESTR